MVVLRYSKAKLVTASALTFGLTLAYLWLVLDPPQGRLPLSIRFLAHSPRLAPMIAGGLLVVVWRGLSLAASGAAALETQADALVTTTWWRTRRVPWRAITLVSVKRIRTRYNHSDQLVLTTLDDEVSVPLGCTEDLPGGIERLLEDIDALRHAALAAPAGGRATVRASEPAAAPASPGLQPARPAFGRKGL